MTKKRVLYVGLGGTILILFLFVLNSNYCYLNPFCIDNFMVFFLIPPPILFFSLLTYRMRDEVFDAWISFAKWFVPVIILITLIIQSGSGGGSGGFSGAVSGWFDAMIIGLLYIIFIIVSLLIIVRKHYSLKKKNNL